ncbi:MAG: chorismate synthase, partial [Sandaracinaceae bacterium]|nr:chorismate synthase [Sandaracinaceae bacterium]
MPGSTIGQVFRVTTAGESHGPAILAIIDGCPAGLEIDRSDLVAELQKRRPGQSPLASSRNEEDEPEILSGIYEGRSTGAPIAILIRNRNSRSEDYEALVSTYRPGHADWSHEAKYGIRDPRGGGRASARETAARVCAGAIAKKLLRTCFGTEIVAYTMRVGPIEAPPIDIDQLTREAIERLPSGEPNWMRCPDPQSTLAMAACVEAARAQGDSLGGIAEILARNVPPGLGEPVFDKLKADLAKALFSIPAVTGLEFGSGFRAAS